MKITGSFFFDGITAKQQWAVYIITLISKEFKSALYYVGKVGDNRSGCNPIISRIGNHLSFNRIHGQVKNYFDNNNLDISNYFIKIDYVHLGDYNEHENQRPQKLNMTNESERELIRHLYNLLSSSESTIINPVVGRYFTRAKMKLYETYISDDDRELLQEFAINVLDENRRIMKAESMA